MKIIGIVVLYHPPSDIVDNIISYISGLDKLIIWNNSIQDKIIFPEEYKEQGGKIIEMGDGTNAGLGAAYNSAITYAREHHYTHLLTMDQDSRFRDNDFQIYADFIRQSSEKTIFSVAYNAELLKQNSVVEVEATISSGAVYPITVFDEIGMFREDFFIEGIDVEYSLRAKQNGIPTKRVCFVYLIHNINDEKQKEHRFLWKTFTTIEYSPILSYYVIRNGAIIKKNYPKANEVKGYFYYYFYMRLFSVILYERNKFAKCKGLILGYLHGKTGKTGKQRIFNERPSALPNLQFDRMRNNRTRNKYN
jgi:rhamnosyltransferase